jgi:hypothetical protein
MFAGLVDGVHTSAFVINAKFVGRFHKGDCCPSFLLQDAIDAFLTLSQFECIGGEFCLCLHGSLIFSGSSFVDFLFEFLVETILNFLMFFVSFVGLRLCFVDGGVIHSKGVWLSDLLHKSSNFSCVNASVV